MFLSLTALKISLKRFYNEIKFQNQTKTKFLSDFNINKILIINDLLKNDEKELIKLVISASLLTIKPIIQAEIILVVSSITSKDNYYLDRLFELDESIQTYYLTVIEKYIEVGKDKKNHDKVVHHEHKSITNNAFVEELENKHELLKSKYNDLEKEFMELNLRHKDAIIEINFQKNKNLNSIEVQEELIKDTIMFNQLKNDFEQKDNEIEDLKRDLELINKRNNEEKMKLKVVLKIIYLKDKISEYEDKLHGYKNLHQENERLKAKIKEYNLLKDKIKEYDDIVITLELKNKQIEKLISEKQASSLQIEKLNKEIATEKEKCRGLIYEKKKYELELNDLKDVSRTELSKKRSDKMNETMRDKSFIAEKGNRLNMLDESIGDWEKKEEKDNLIKSLEKDVNIIINY